MIKALLNKKLRGAAGAMDLELELSIAEGSFNALFGPSGAGKTSTLRMISGFMRPDSGLITTNGHSWFNSKEKINIKPGKRNIGFVFQNLALFPNMSVLENMRYAAGKNQDETLFKELLEVSELGSLADQKSAELSGGQQRRAALIRAIAQQPDLLLLDEPFSGIDNQTRLRLQDYLADLHQRFKFTVILVSHDIAEVCKLAENIWQIEEGKIIKSGTAAQIFGLNSGFGQLQLTAKVVAVAADELSLLIAGSIVNWKIRDDRAQYKIGQMVSLSFDQNTGTLTQLKEER